jgi:hypothetical protein
MAMVPQGWSISAIAVELGRDRRTVAAACAQVEPCGSDRRGKLYRLADVVPMLVSGGKPADVEEAKARKLAAEAELAEITLAKARRELVAIDAVAQAVGDEYAAVRAKLLSLPTKLAPLVAIEEREAACRDLIERGITEALNELSRDAAAIVDCAAPGAGDGAGAVVEAAAEAHGQRVG